MHKNYYYFLKPVQTSKSRQFYFPEFFLKSMKMSTKYNIASTPVSHRTKTQNDELCDNHRMVVVHDWLFPISTFSMSHFSLLTTIHVPINHKDSVWNCPDESAIHIEDWTNFRFVDQPSFDVSPKHDIPFHERRLLKHHLSVLLHTRDQKFGQKGRATLRTIPPTTCKIIYVKKIGACVLIIPYREEKDGRISLQYDGFFTASWSGCTWEKDGWTPRKLALDKLEVTWNDLQIYFDSILSAM